MQPYQQGLPTNRQGSALQAMLAGRTLYGQNPMDAQRQSVLTMLLLGQRKPVSTVNTPVR